LPDVPGVPSAEELSALPHAELAARLAEAYRVIGELTAQGERLPARVGQMERQAGKDSSTSSRPPSSDSPYKKKGKDRSLRERGKRRPGKQPGEPGATMMLGDGHRGGAARACAGAGQLRAGDARASREPDRRAPYPHLAVHGAAVPAGRHRRLGRVDGRDPGEGSRAGGRQRVHGPGPPSAEDRPGGARR